MYIKTTDKDSIVPHHCYFFVFFKVLFVVGHNKKTTLYETRACPH